MFRHTCPSPRSLAGALLHPVEVLQRKANRVRPCADSAFAQDQAVFEMLRNGPAKLVRLSPAACSRGNQPTESPSTTPRHNATGKSALPAETSTTHRDQKLWACLPILRPQQPTAS